MCMLLGTLEELCLNVCPWMYLPLGLMRMLPQRLPALKHIEIAVPDV